MQEVRGGIVGTYFSGVKMTLKVGITPMETTTYFRKADPKHFQLSCKLFNDERCVIIFHVEHCFDFLLQVEIKTTQPFQ